MWSMQVVSAEQFENAPFLVPQLRVLLRDGHLPEGVLTQLVAALGAAALREACQNVFVSDDEWIALYRAAPTAGRVALVQSRVLSARQRNAVVLEFRETAVEVLRLIVEQLDRIELDIISAQTLQEGALALVSAAQERLRTGGAVPVRSVNDAGLVAPLEEPYDLPWVTPEALPTSLAEVSAEVAPAGEHGRAHERRWAQSLVAVLSAELDHDPLAWVTAAHLMGDYAGTWLELAWTAAAAAEVPGQGVSSPVLPG